MDYNSVLGLLLLSAVSVLILKTFGFKGAPLVAIVAVTAALSHYKDVFSEISAVFSYIGDEFDSSEYISGAFKVVGISYLAGISSDCLREIGENGIAKCVGVVTKLELVVISLPYIKEILSSALSFAL